MVPESKGQAIYSGDARTRCSRTPWILDHSGVGLLGVLGVAQQLTIPVYPHPCTVLLTHITSRGRAVLARILTSNRVVNYQTVWAMRILLTVPEAEITMRMNKW